MLENENRARALIPFNDLKRAAVAQELDLNAAARRVISSGWYVHGREHREFEAAFAEYLGVGYVLGVASGTDALELALRSVRTSSRTTVISVANAGAYTTCAALAAGMSVTFTDIDTTTHLLSPTALEPLLSDETAAVVVTHLYGRLADAQAVRRLCDPLGIKVIEDCAQSAGARTPDGMGGSIGHLATFSFYPTKNLGALGDGGAIVTSDSALASRLRELRQYGWTAKYRNETPGGRNSRLDEIQAAFLNHRLPLLDSGNERRRLIINLYAQASPSYVHVLPADGRHHSGHLAVVETDHAVLLRAHMSSQGIATEVHYPTPDHRQPFIADTDVILPVTDSKHGRILSLPCFPELTDDEIDAVCIALSDFKVPEMP